MDHWNEAQKFEKDWWGNCANTFWEETKQIVYAKKMGLKAISEYGKYPVYDLGFKTILDIGGGPVSMLLKCKNGHGIVVDPCDYPDWVVARYTQNKIGYEKMKGENYRFSPGVQIAPYDECWIYNVLQHVEDPELIIKNARAVSKIVRIFEWIDTYVSPGHPHILKEENLNKWLGGEGKTEMLNESGCHGLAYYGVFKGEHYEEKI